MSRKPFTVTNSVSIEDSDDFTCPYCFWVDDKPDNPHSDEEDDDYSSGSGEHICSSCKKLFEYTIVIEPKYFTYRMKDKND